MSCIATMFPTCGAACAGCGHRPGTVLTLRDDDFERVLISEPKSSAKQQAWAAISQAEPMAVGDPADLRAEIDTALSN